MSAAPSFGLPDGKFAMPATDQDFEQFVRANWSAIVTFAYLICNDWYRAEDLVQSSLANCYRKWEHIRDPARYVRSAVTREYLSVRRRRWFHELPIATDPQIEVAASAPEDRAYVSQLLKILTPRQRVILVLRFFDDYSQVETAAILGISVGAVKSQQAHALTRLRDKIENLSSEER